MDRLQKLKEQFIVGAPARMPEKVVLQGRYARLEPLNTEKHYRSLFKNLSETPNIFDYMLELPLTTLEEFKERCLIKENDPTRIHFVISKLVEPDDYIGMNCFANIDPINKKIEVGRTMYSRKLQNTMAATDTTFQMMSYAFDTLGYGRLQAWSHVDNKKAYEFAKRGGFHFEGTTRRYLVFNGIYFDVDIWSMMDYEWPPVKKAFNDWLDPSNFDEHGKQKKPITIVLKNKEPSSK